jgi:hypothetical protein
MDSLRAKSFSILWVAGALLVVSALLTSVSTVMWLGALVGVVLFALRRHVFRAVGRVVRWRGFIATVIGVVCSVTLFAGCGLVLLIGHPPSGAGPPDYSPFKNYYVLVTPSDADLNGFDVAVTMDYDPSLSYIDQRRGAPAQPVRLPAQRVYSSAASGWLLHTLYISSPANLDVPIVLNDGSTVQRPVCRATCPPMTIELHGFPAKTVVGPLSGFTQQLSDVGQLENVSISVSAADAQAPVGIEYVSQKVAMARPPIDPILGLSLLGVVTTLLIGLVLMIGACAVTAFVSAHVNGILRRFKLVPSGESSPGPVDTD